MLQPIGTEIWTAQGPVVTGGMGFHYPTRMVVIRLPGEGLFVWSPIALSPELQAAIDALGTVRHLIGPNTLHHSFLGAWKAAYPEAMLWAAPGLRTQRSELPFDADLGSQPPADWAEQIAQVVVEGNTITTEVVFFHKASGTALFTDLIQHLPKDWYSGWRALVARLDLMTAPSPSVPRKFRVAFKDRKAARVAVDHMLNWPIKQVVIAHGAPVYKDGHALVRRAFDWLSKR